MQTIVLDFDGVIRKFFYGDPLDGGIPVQQSKEGIKTLIDSGYKIVICTARTDTDNVKKWLNNNGYPDIEVTNNKPQAIAYVDDKAIKFINWHNLIEKFTNKILPNKTKKSFNDKVTDHKKRIPPRDFRRFA